MAAKNGKVAVVEEEEEIPAPPKKKIKRLEYIGGSEEFGGEHNVKVAIRRAEGFRATLDETQATAFNKLLKDMRDHIGWTKGGRVLLTGKAERG